MFIKIDYSYQQKLIPNKFELGTSRNLMAIASFKLYSTQPLLLMFIVHVAVEQPDINASKNRC